jgi:hypothetical protein
LGPQSTVCVTARVEDVPASHGQVHNFVEDVIVAEHLDLPGCRNTLPRPIHSHARAMRPGAAILMRLEERVFHDVESDRLARFDRSIEHCCRELELVTWGEEHSAELLVTAAEISHKKAPTNMQTSVLMAALRRAGGVPSGWWCPRR